MVLRRATIIDSLSKTNIFRYFSQQIVLLSRTHINQFSILPGLVHHRVYLKGLEPENKGYICKIEKSIPTNLPMVHMSQILPTVRIMVIDPKSSWRELRMINGFTKFFFVTLSSDVRIIFSSIFVKKLCWSRIGN